MWLDIMSRVVFITVNYVNVTTSQLLFVFPHIFYLGILYSVWFYVAFYPSPDLFEMDFLCYVIDVRVASKDQEHLSLSLIILTEDI